MPSQFDKEKIRKKISLMLEKVKTEADPQLLNEYRSLFKKEVSFFRRSWAAAYLLMFYDQGQNSTGRFDKGGSRDGAGGKARKSGEQSGRTDSPRKDTPRNDTPRNEIPRPPLPEEESRRLFISIGRNRRVFPREILGLINAKTSISRDDIGAIRILDNYSFVQVRSSVADEIIEALNGKPFRGRVLTVNYARARREDAPEGAGEDRDGDREIRPLADAGTGETDYPEAEDRGPDASDAYDAGDIAEDSGADYDEGEQDTDGDTGAGSDQDDDQSDKEGV
jgi:hypothetical protein